MGSCARVAVIGGESTGKSHLAAAIAARYDGVVARDILRDVVATLGRTPTRVEQRGLFELQSDTITAAGVVARATGRHVVVADPDPFMTAVYSQVYFADDSLRADGLASLASADVVVWCRPDIPWIADGAMRDGERFRAAADAVITGSLADSGLRVISTTAERTTHPAWVPDLSAFLP